MQPSGMETMTTPVEVLPSTEPGVYRFKADLPMEGGWRLSLGAKVQGEGGTIETKLVLKAKREAGRPGGPRPRRRLAAGAGGYWGGQRDVALPLVLWAGDHLRPLSPTTDGNAVPPTGLGSALPGASAAAPARGAAVGSRRLLS